MHFNAALSKAAASGSVPPSPCRNVLVPWPCGWPCCILVSQPCSVLVGGSVWDGWEGRYQLFLTFQSCGARIPQRRALVMWSSPAAVLPALSLEVTLFLSTSHQVCTFCRVCHLRKEEGSRQDGSFQPDVGESSCPTGAGLMPALQKCIRSCSVDERLGACIILPQLRWLNGFCTVQLAGSPGFALLPSQTRAGALRPRLNSCLSHLWFPANHGQ